MLFSLARRAAAHLFSLVRRGVTVLMLPQRVAKIRKYVPGASAAIAGHRRPCRRPHEELPLPEILRSAALSQAAYADPPQVAADLSAICDRAAKVCTRAGALDALLAVVGPPLFVDGSPRSDAQAYVWFLPADRTAIVAFRGTKGMQDVRTDSDVRRVPFVPMCPREGAVSDGIRVHSGFWQQYVSVRVDIHAALLGLCPARVIFCGHSLGGGLATLAALDRAWPAGAGGADAGVECHTFGSPRTGNPAFSQCFRAHVPVTWRMFNANDPVPMVPITHRFEHVHGGVCIDDDCTYEYEHSDTPWFCRPLIALLGVDSEKPIADHSCGLYIDRICAHLA